MAVDPRNLRPADVTRLLNSTPLGTVIDDRHIYRHRMRAGFRIGDGRRVDVFRYAAWLLEEYEAPAKIFDPAAEYEVLKERVAARDRARSEAGRDIGKLPDVVDAARKAEAEKDFRFFCQAYFPLTFYLAWSPDHLKIIARIEQAVIDGGLFALATPRGSGKTCIAECACMWAMLYGHREFVCLIGASQVHAVEMLESIKMELDGNDLLLADFPEVAHPIRCLEGIANRCSGQLYEGERTHIGWTATEVVLPTMPGSKGGAAIIKVAGITGRIRGLKYKRADGQTVRPSLVVLDDPQTDESARSLSQCATREAILAGAVLGLAGPAKKIAGIMPCTVIRPGDMADNILDTDKHPGWNGERTRMVYSFPSNEKLWAKYAEVRGESLRMHGDIRKATAFYRKHRKALDKGAEVAWPQRFNKDELSAIQHAMNLKLQDEAAFAAEYQNEPLVDVGTGVTEMMDADSIAAKTNGRRRRDVPLRCEYLTAFIDVHEKVLFYAVAAWETNFTGYVIDYGTHPRQGAGYFTVRSVERTLRRAHQGAGVEGAIYAGLEVLTDELLGREWRREDGALMRITICLIDQGWQTELIHLFCRQSKHAALLLPSRGHGVTAAHKPFYEYDRKRGDRIGHYWWVPTVTRRRSLRHAEVDTNYWKSFVHQRLATAMGDAGCLSLFGSKPEPHRVFADHLVSEYYIQTEGRGRTVDEWRLRPHTSENHWLDCLVGCYAGASMQGVTLLGEPGPRRTVLRAKEKLDLTVLQRQRRAESPRRRFVGVRS